MKIELRIDIKESYEEIIDKGLYSSYIKVQGIHSASSLFLTDLMVLWCNKTLFLVQSNQKYLPLKLVKSLTKQGYIVFNLRC